MRRLLGEEERVVVEEVDKQNEVVEDSKVEDSKEVVGKEGREGRSEEGAKGWRSQGNVDLVSFDIDVDVYRSAVFWSILQGQLS